MKLRKSIWSLALCCLAALVSQLDGSELATATLSSSQLDATTWQYSLSLSDAGTTNLGTFWFSWIPGEDLLPSSPSSIASPASWTDVITNAGATDGFAILWQANTGSELKPGQTLPGFQFDSTASPTELAGNSPFFPDTPILTSFVYSGAPFSDSGLQFVAQNQGPATATPEPATGAIAALALGLFCLGRGLGNRTPIQTKGR